MTRSFTFFRWVMGVAGTLLAAQPFSSQAQQAPTELKAGDVLITGVNSTNPDVFSFVPLVDLAAGTQLKFTDKGWYHNGGFRGSEGVVTFTVPAGGIARGAKVLYSTDAAVCAPGFTKTGQFDLADTGDQLLVYQGPDTAPRFVYGLSLRKGWTDARSDNTSALPAGLTEKGSAVALSWANAHPKQNMQRKGGANRLRGRFNKDANWTGSNTTATTWYSQPAYNANLIVEDGVDPRLSYPPFEAGQGLSRVRTLTYTDDNLANPTVASLPFGGLCGKPSGVRRVQLRIKFSANSLVDPGGGEPSVEMHNLGEEEFDGYVYMTLYTDNTSFTPNPVELKINKAVPEQTYLLDLTKQYEQFMLTGAASVLNVNVKAYKFEPPHLAPNARMTVTLEESYYNPPTQAVLPTNPTATAGRLEQVLPWQPMCFTETYQLQLLKLTEDERQDSRATQALLNASVAWRQRATTLDFQTTSSEWPTTFGEGYGTYYYRVRALSNSTNVITNPENWGAWSAPVRFELGADDTGQLLNLAKLNWIYSRTFTEGGRVSEKITYANGLLQPRQTLTRLASTRQVIGLQTVQDYVGRDALQSLPIPIVGGDRFLTYKPNLLRKFTTTGSPALPYQAVDFDQDAGANPSTVTNPAKAREQGYYDSSAPVYATATPNSTTPVLNAGVADAEGYPFSRTLFTNDGTNRVREQGSAGLTLGLGQGHTVRTYYAGVAQDELDKLMGKEAPMANKTFKTLTFDPNGTTSVTYQTLDGKTIATALAGQGGPNLDALPATPAASDPRDKISVTMTEKLDYNGIGTVGRQLLVMTESNVKIDLSYELTPATVADNCAVATCSTCDYLVTIKCYRLEDGATLAPIYTTSRELTASCLASGTKVSLPGQFTTGAAGTYVIEKRVTAYNSAAGSATSYLDDKIVALQQTYDGYPNQMPWKGTGGTQGLTDYLTSTPPNITGFYAALQSGGYPVVTTADGLQHYEVPFGCDPADKIAIPLLLPCGSGRGSACTGTPSFENIFTTRWANTSYTLAQAMPSFPYSPGSFDQMITAMLQNSSATGFSGKCADLQDCWTAQVEAYEDMVTASNPAVGGPPVDLAQSFLACAQELLTSPCSPQPCTSVPTPSITSIQVAPLSPNQFYNTAAYYTTPAAKNAACVACLGAVLTRDLVAEAQAQGTTPANYAQGLLAGVTPEQATNYARCLRSGQVPTFTASSNAPTAQQAAAQITAQLMGSCEGRREEFRQAVRDRATAKNLRVDDCELDKLTNELVLKCQTDAQVSSADFEPVPNAPASMNPAPMQLNAAARTRLQRVHLGRAVVEVLAYIDEGGGDSREQCAPGTDCQLMLEPAYNPYTSPPQYFYNLRPTRAAIQLLDYANQALRAANQANALLPLGQRTTTLGCPVNGEGAGEPSLNVFTYTGRLGALPENLAPYIAYPGATPEPNRRNYWAVVQLQNPLGTTNSRVTFTVQLPAIVNGAAAPAALSACLPTGDEPLGVPKLPTATAYFTTSFELEPVSGPALTALAIASLSAPYCKYTPVDIKNQNNQAAGVYVQVTLKNGSVVEAELRVSGNNVISWRTAVCSQQIPGNTQTSRSYHACLAWADPLPVTVPPGVPVATIPTCEQLQVQQLLAAIQSQQQQLKADHLAGYRTRYQQACATPENLNDKLVLGYQLGYHHYTLYYYDRAGQLMKTVPPAGVQPLDLTNPNHPAYPDHRLVTQYTYNSLGQLVHQHTPDGGDTRFYYNAAGQLRFSMNDQQLHDKKYSFTVYDALGRVVKVGETTYNFSLASGSDELSGPLADLDLATTPPASTVTNLTETTYTSRGRVLYLDGTPQRYLNNRVSYVTAYPHGYDDPRTEPAVTYYSYDPHGNVEWLSQHVPGLGDKCVRYEYDLISNKVTQVAYQEGRVDQYFHRYKYDDDNRLLVVETSGDRLVWETDAEYRYYAHGPLKRAMLGDDRVQGLDYAYTLQGWLKALNHPGLDRDQDAGQDGVSSGAGADVFGMVLGYYRGDYRHQGNWLDGAPTPAAVLAEPAGGSQLYNGNIASWSSKSLGLSTQAAAPPLTAEHYRYDQLNRLTSSQQRASTGGSWAATNQYGTSYAYDPNGNLTSLQRQAGQAGQFMDNLSYEYARDGQGNLASNQLLRVGDTVGAGVSDEDVDNQSQGNYAYDAVGNLTKDTQGWVQNIGWTPYGKVGQIQRTNGQVLYRYDGQGNRISKQVQLNNNPSLTTHYVRDATGNVLAVYEARDGQPLQLVEQPLYGSARVGERKPTLSMPDPEAEVKQSPLVEGVYVDRTLGLKYYEVNDHLGNVRAVLTDQKTSSINGTYPDLGTILPVLSNYYNYYAFGQLQPGRYGYGNTGSTAPAYRFGFNGQEKAEEIDPNHTTALFWEYDSRLGRRWNMDPVKKPWQSDYSCLSNSPLWKIDPDGDDDFFNADGTRLMRRTASGSNIFVQTAKGNELITNINLSNANNRQTVANIVGHYANQVGITYQGKGSNNNAGAGRVGVKALKVDGKSADAHAGQEGKNIYVNIVQDRLDSEMGDVNNLKSALWHENGHKSLNTSNPNANSVQTNRQHLDVYFIEIEAQNANFGNTTPKFQNSTITAISTLLTNLYTVDNYTLEDVEALARRVNGAFEKANSTFKITENQMNGTFGVGSRKPKSSKK